MGVSEVVPAEGQFWVLRNTNGALCWGHRVQVVQVDEYRDSRESMVKLLDCDHDPAGDSVFAGPVPVVEWVGVREWPAPAPGDPDPVVSDAAWVDRGWFLANADYLHGSVADAYQLADLEDHAAFLERCCEARAAERDEARALAEDTQKILTERDALRQGVLHLGTALRDHDELAERVIGALQGAVDTLREQLAAAKQSGPVL